MDGYVYLLKELGDDLLHKIGVTRSYDIEKRIKKMQTGNGNKIVLVACYKTNRPFKMEKMLHFRFRDNREEGEWFLLSQEDVKSFIPLCEQFQETINAMADNPFF